MFASQPNMALVNHSSIYFNKQFLNNCTCVLGRVVKALDPGLFNCLNSSSEMSVGSNPTERKIYFCLFMEGQREVCLLRCRGDNNYVVKDLCS